MLHYLWFEKLA